MNTKYWQRELDQFNKRVEDWHKQAGDTDDRYLGRRTNNRTNAGTFETNLFHSNVDGLSDILAASSPDVDVSRRYADSSDDAARVAATLLKRLLNTDIDEDDGAFMDTMRSCLQDRLIPGMGVARVRYEVVEDPTAEDAPPLYEDAPIDYVHWRDFAWGYARQWSDVPWVGFASRFTKGEAVEAFGEDIAKGLTYDDAKPQQDDEDDTSGGDIKDSQQTARVWEIWNKKDRVVYTFQSGYPKFLKPTVRDPLKLRGFFPCPEPLVANTTTTLFMPKPDFVFVQDYYNEIDILQTRIHYLTKAMKARGVYDKSADGVSRLLTEGEENDLIPVDNWAMFAEKGGMRGVVDWFPVDVIANVLNSLRDLLDSTIALLYQVLGISDMLTGGGVTGGQPSSATEQALRAKFSGVRVNSRQNTFATFASRLQMLKAQVISLHFHPRTIVERSNARMLPEAMTNPQLVQAGVQLIKNPGRARWRVSIKPEAIGMADRAEVKQDRVEFLTALATFMQSAQAIGKIGPELVPALIGLLKVGIASFPGADEMEGILDEAIEEFNKRPQQATPDPAMLKARMDIEKQQMKFQQDIQKELLKSRNDMQKLMADLQKNLLETQAKTEAKVKEEAAQAHFNIMEKEANGS